MVEETPDKQADVASDCSLESHSTNIDSSIHKSSRLVISFTFLSGFGLVGVSIWLHQQEWIRELRWITWLALVIGLSLFLASMHIVQAKNAPNWLSRPCNKLEIWFGIEDWQVVCLVISPVFALVAWLAAGTDAMMNNSFMAISCWLLGIGLVTLSGWQFAKEEKPFPTRTVLTAMSFFLLALFIRGIYVNNIPIVLTGDEASAGLSAVGFIKGDTNNIFRVGWFSFPSLYFFIQSIPVSLLGQTILALRISSIIAGSLTVVGVYLLARAMFGERAGLYSALFLVAFHFHNHFSRIGLNNIWDSMWFVIVLGLLWAGWHNENRRLLLLSGLTLGISQYFYVSARLLFLIIPTWLIIVGFIKPFRIRRLFPSLLLMAIAALVTMMPLALYYLGHPSELMAPLRRASILGGWLSHEITITGHSPWQILLNQLWVSFQAYAHQPLRAWYTPGVPLLRPFPAALFFLGASLLLLKLRDSRTALLGLWIIFITMMVGISESTPAAQRYVAVSPAIAILVGFGLAESAMLLGKMWSQVASFIGLLAVGFIIFISLDDLRFYFLDYTPHSDFGGENTLVAHQLANYLLTQPDNLEVFFIGGSRMGYYSHSSLPFLAPHVKGMDIKHPWGSPENPQPSSHNLLFVLLPETHEELERIEASYPGGQYMEVRKTDGITLFWLYKHSSSELLPSESHLPGKITPLALNIYNNSVIGGIP
jgi:4-amino-4-deoxy-L-arabinose transferase-like glycosyltransferase